MGNNSVSVGNGRSCQHFIIFSLCFLLASATTGNDMVHILRDSDEDSFVSEGGIFELGFFTPEGISEIRRYVGIWYHDFKPRTLVWVANRDQPLLNKNGSFAIRDSNLVVLTSNGTSLWSSGLQLPPSHNSTTMKLMPSGNLILKELGGEGKTVWESFQNPTDTFLPGMNMTNGLRLTSWKSAEDPSRGDFTFLKDLENRYIIEKHSVRYWVSKEWPNLSGDEMFDEVIDSLSKVSVGGLQANNFTFRFNDQELDFNYTRAAMDFKGKIEYLARNRVSGKWDVIWWEPRNNCSIVNTCGNFASCVSGTKHRCRCLPGFEPKSKDEWDSGYYSNGCRRKTEICHKQVPQAKDFVTINMRVKRTSNIVQAENNMTCRTKCLESCSCQAYSEVTTNKRSDRAAFAIWDDELQSIWENPFYGSSGEVNIRIKRSDIEFTEFDCEPCGSTIVPYPLSTAPNCGNSIYSNFTCLEGFGSRFFFVPGHFFYRVTNMDPQLRTFTIRTANGSICRRGNDDTDAIQKLLNLEHLSIFKVRSGCDSKFDEVNIQWEKPLEPICKSQRDCTNWPNSSCNSSTTDGTKRCLCNSSFNWTGTGCHINMPPIVEDVLNRPPPKKRNVIVDIIIPVTVIAGFVTISWLALHIYFKKRKALLNKKEQRRRGFWRNNQETAHLYESEKRVRDFMGSGKFGEDDRKAIEVPVFDFETILSATHNFSEANKLGRGGFGTVYKGLFPGGLEIAIKRLSQGSAHGIDEFKNEAILIAKLQHRNLVRLLGYCVAGEEKIVGL